MSHLFLTGFMGAGKTTVGRIVARRLGLPFLDLDQEVEARDGRSISAIFAESGEEAFRCAETDALSALSEQPDSVVACGGGVVLRPENRGLLERLGTVYYLVVTAEDALRRLDGSGGRPLLENEAERMASTLLDARASLYAAVADETIDTVGRSPDQVALEIVARVRTGGPIAAVVPVRTPGRSYEVLAGRDLLPTLGPRMRAALPALSRVAIVTDSGVGPLFAEAAAASLVEAGVETAVFEVPAGEASKSWGRAGEVVTRFAFAGLERTAAVVALGGGVVGDLAGFCASVYLRGVPVVQVPTTLLAQVDSAIGGKTGVDLEAGKNLAGTFWQPSLVLADTTLLATLPASEWRSGLAEVVKTAILAGEEEIAGLEADAERLRHRDADAVERTVAMCVRYKAGVVSSDERESGERECLNLGHTLGHAIEKVAGFGVVPHGLAVAEGIRFAARLAVTLGLAGERWAERQEALLDAVGLPAEATGFDGAALHETMRADKKVRGGRIRFVLSIAPGSCEVREVEDTVLEECLAAWPGTRG